MEKVTITAQDVRLVEQVIGPMNYGRAALHGTASGALPGVLIGWLFGHANWLDPVVSALLLALYGLIFGAVVGALFGMPLHALQDCRAFASLRSMQPNRYEDVVDEAIAYGAVRPIGALQTTGGGPIRT